jgi:hypothetical protein
MISSEQGFPGSQAQLEVDFEALVVLEPIKFGGNGRSIDHQSKQTRT